MKEIVIPLFVYGTLMKGQANHKRYMTRILNLKKATVGPARLWSNGGFPALEIDESLVLSEGSMDYDRDISISAKFMKDKDLIPKKVEKIKPEENINHPFLPKIEGELIVLPYDLGLLRNLDLLEGFSENDKFYHRVLIPVTARAVGKDNNKISEKESLEVAWTYIMRNISKNSGMRPFNKNVWRP